MQNKKLPKLPNSDYVCINFGHSNTMQTDITSWLHFTIANITAFSLTLICNLSISSAQFSSVAQSCPTLCDPMTAARQASLSITNSQSSLRLTSIKPVMPSSHLMLCHPLLLLPQIPPSIRVFSNESTFRMRWPKYWHFQL